MGSFALLGKDFGLVFAPAVRAPNSSCADAFFTSRKARVKRERGLFSGPCVCTCTEGGFFGVGLETAWKASERRRAQVCLGSLSVAGLFGTGLRGRLPAPPSECRKHKQLTRIRPCCLLPSLPPSGIPSRPSLPCCFLSFNEFLLMPIFPHLTGARLASARQLNLQTGRVRLLLLPVCCLSKCSRCLGGGVTGAIFKKKKEGGQTIRNPPTAIRKLNMI